MDDDGRSGRWMAGGNVGKLTHLEAFTSEDAKRGRVWQDETDDFRRVCNRLERRYRKGGRGWEQSDVQVASFDGVVTWADEPKTLTPQEALRALADGKVLIDKDLLWKLGGDGCIYTKYGSAPWEECPSQSFNDWHVVPDPSQPAEPARPPLKVGDRVKRGPDWKWPNDARRGGVVDEVDMDAEEVLVKWDSGFTSCHRYGAEGKYDIEKIEAEPHDDDKVKRSPGCECHLEVGDSPCRVHGEDEEAEPKIEYPLNYEEAMQARDNGHEIASCIGPGKAKARWRIVDGGK